MGMFGNRGGSTETIFPRSLQRQENKADKDAAFFKESRRSFSRCRANDSKETLSERAPTMMLVTVHTSCGRSCEARKQRKMR